MESINYEPIGIIRTQYTETLDMPIQAALAQKSVLAVAEISEQFVEGLTDLTGFSHIILIYHFHKSREAPMMQKPFLDDQKHGVFNRLYFNGADMLDESPLLDIKPFVPQFDHRETDMIGWLKGKF